MKSLGLLVLSVAIGIWYAFVAWRLWTWFAIPLGAPVIPFIHAFGLYCLASSIMVWGLNVGSEKDIDSLAGKSLGKASVAAIILLEGYIAHAMS